MKYVVEYLNSLLDLTLEMAPWLMLGFLFAGILHVYFSTGMVLKYMGKPTTKSSMFASMLGVPMPLCSCGVIPTGISFYKTGASKGSSVSFLVSTPQTGVDSVMATYALLGLPFAIVRPIIAFITGVVGGMATNFFTRGEYKNGVTPNSAVKNQNGQEEREKGLKPILRYAFIDFFREIAKWLFLGLILAAFIDVLIPDNYFESTVGKGIWGMLLMLAASVPLYVCSTGSVPIAAVLILKGLSPGAVLVFLMAGPATNIATMLVLGKTFGRKTLIVYMLTIILGAISFGLILDYFFPAQWFTGYVSEHLHQHLLPGWFTWAMTAILIALFINTGLMELKNRFMKKPESKFQTTNFKPMSIKELNVSGMTCQHCKQNVENAARSVEGVEWAEADIKSNKVKVSGDSIDIEKLKANIEGAGYSVE